MFFELDSFRKTIPCFGSSTFGLAVSRFFSKMSDCNFGDALGKFLKTGARPDSEARTLGNATVTWNGNSFALTSRKGCVGNIYFSCAAVQDSSNCLGQLGGCLFARMFFFGLVAGMLLYLDIRCSLSLPFYLRSTRASHANRRHDSHSILFSFILFYSPLRVAMRLPVFILIMTSSHACSSRSITIQCQVQLTQGTTWLVYENPVRS